MTKRSISDGAGSAIAKRARDDGGVVVAPSSDYEVGVSPDQNQSKEIVQ